VPAVADPETAPRRVRVRVPAKINPFLAVRGVRDDGYHELVTVFQTLALSDTLVLSLDAPGGRLHHPTSGGRVAIALTHDAGDALPTGEDNLVVRAAAALADRMGMAVDDGAPVTTSIVLSKQIPIAGGMAGGSADAAGALVGLNELWACDLPRSQLLELAAGLGADVPFCVAGGTALASGTGTGLAAVLARGRFEWVVCTAPEPLPTAAVYAAWDEHGIASDRDADEVLTAVAAGDPDLLGPALHNDLQPAAEALLPRLRADRRALLDAGAVGAVVSGSGPTLLALAADADDAQRIAARVAGRFARTLVTSSPAGGPVVDAG
jgi:4-diphosphocytidyl-2-C-methyl-D-erythritol kinase